MARFKFGKADMIKKLSVFLFVWLSCSTLVLSQKAFRLSPKDSRMIIRGTSTLHNWQCKVEQTSGQMTAEFEGETIGNIKSLVLGVVVNSIKSIDEKGAYYEKGMDKNVYKALKDEKYPTITFTLNRINKRTLIGKDIAFDATGVLRIAGVAKEISLRTVATQTADAILFEGKIPIKMTDYNVDPPTAIFGTIKTGNEIMLEFKMAYRILPAGK
jgi:polyisoprenoid-binding protein YceI